MILKLGSTGSAVAQLQLTLNELAREKYFLLPEGELRGTGTFAEKTEKTVKAFQRKFRLDDDGVVGHDTFAKIDELRLKLTPSRPATAANDATRVALLDKLIGIASHEVGIREVGGNNNGARVRDYQRAADLRPLGPWPWCAAFICWSVHEWVNTYPEVRRALGWNHEEIEAKRPHTASAFAFIDWARRFEQDVLPPDAALEPGMIAVYDFSHISFVKEASKGNNFRTIEGNTNGRGDRDSLAGDGVWEKVRGRNLVRNFIRWRFLALPSEGNFVTDAGAPVGVLPNTRGIGEIPREGLEFIIDEEGMNQPWRFAGGDSGVTIGHGYDLGAGTESKSTMVDDWKKWLSGNELDRLSIAIGRTGEAAKGLCPQFRDINITIEAADDVFYRGTIPKYYQKMLSVFPNADKLPGMAQAALLSLVFNRGTSLKGDRREEMRHIKSLLAGDSPYDLQAIAKAFRDMKELWVGKGLDGLIARREREARFVEEAIT